MARRPRITPGGVCYHVMNRAVLGLTLFEDDADYAAFERVLDQARERADMRICAYTIMPNHFHLVLWPRGDGDLSDFMRWLTMTHVQRWHAHRHDAGRGHLYQSRFKSFPVQGDGHFRKVCRYVERNPLRAGPSGRAASGGLSDWAKFAPLFRPGLIIPAPQRAGQTKTSAKRKGSEAFFIRACSPTSGGRGRGGRWPGPVGRPSAPPSGRKKKGF